MSLFWTLPKRGQKWPILGLSEKTLKIDYFKPFQIIKIMPLHLFINNVSLLILVKLIEDVKNTSRTPKNGHFRGSEKSAILGLFWPKTQNLERHHMGRKIAIFRIRPNPDGDTSLGKKVFGPPKSLFLSFRDFLLNYRHHFVTIKAINVHKIH